MPQNGPRAATSFFLYPLVQHLFFNFSAANWSLHLRWHITFSDSSSLSQIPTDSSSSFRDRPHTSSTAQCQCSIKSRLQPGGQLLLPDHLTSTPSKCCCYRSLRTTTTSSTIRNPFCNTKLITSRTPISWHEPISVRIQPISNSLHCSIEKPANRLINHHCTRPQLLSFLKFHQTIVVRHESSISVWRQLWSASMSYGLGRPLTPSVPSAVHWCFLRQMLF